MRGSIGQRFASMFVLGTLWAFAVGAGGCGAPASTSPADDPQADGKADGTRGGLQSASELIVGHVFLNSQGEYYGTHPQSAEGHIKGFDCRGSGCHFMYYTTEALHTRFVTSTLEILEKDRATDDCSTVSEVPGRLEVTVTSDQLGGYEYDYAYAYRWTYHCATGQLDIGARDAAELDTLARSH